MEVGADYQKLQVSALQGCNDRRTVEVDVGNLFGLFLNAIQVLIVILVRPGVEKCKKYFLGVGEGVLKAPFDPPLVVLLDNKRNTMELKLILSLTRFHYCDDYSR